MHVLVFINYWIEKCTVKHWKSASMFSSYLHEQLLYHLKHFLRFYVWLTVRPVMIHGKWPTWRWQFFSMHLFQFSACFEQPRAGVQVGNFLSDLHKKRSPTQSDIYQRLYWYNWFSWWWARRCSKHVENWNKYIEKNCESSWSFTMNHFLRVLQSSIRHRNFFELNRD